MVNNGLRNNQISANNVCLGMTAQIFRVDLVNRDSRYQTVLRHRLVLAMTLCSINCCKLTKNKINFKDLDCKRFEYEKIFDI